MSEDTYIDRDARRAANRLDCEGDAEASDAIYSLLSLCERLRTENAQLRRLQDLPSMENVREACGIIARHYNSSLDEVTGRGRAAKVMRARRAVIRFLRARGWSTTRIGRFLNRHHSSVLNALKVGAPATDEEAELDE